MYITVQIRCILYKECIHDYCFSLYMQLFQPGLHWMIQYFSSLKHLKLPCFGPMEGNKSEDCKLWALLSHGPLSFVQIWLGAGSFGSVEWWRERGCMGINETLSWIGAWDFHPLAWSLMHRPRHVQARCSYRGNSNELVLILWLLAHQSRAKPIPVFTRSFF